MVLVANDVARFKAERGCEEYGVAAVREELLAEHVPVLVERGIVRYDEPEDRLELTADPDAVRERVGAVEEYE